VIDGQSAERASQAANGLGVLLDGQPPAQRREHPHRVGVQMRQRARKRRTQLRIGVVQQFEEETGAPADQLRRLDEGPDPRGVLLLVLEDAAQLLRVRLLLSRDAAQQSDDRAPVGHRRCGDQLEEERHARDRAVVHIPLVVHRPVHPVQRDVPPGRVVRGETPQQLRDVRRRVRIGVSHRRPVDILDPREHMNLPRGQWCTAATDHSMPHATDNGSRGTGRALQMTLMSSTAQSLEDSFRT
jgi:hypothetical protein